MDILSFWNLVKLLAKTRKISLKNLALAIGMPYPTLRNWIYYNRIPDVETACEIASILNVSVEYLVSVKNQ